MIALGCGALFVFMEMHPAPELRSSQSQSWTDKVPPSMVEQPPRKLSDLSIGETAYVSDLPLRVSDERHLWISPSGYICAYIIAFARITKWQDGFYVRMMKPLEILGRSDAEYAKLGYVRAVEVR